MYTHITLKIVQDDALQQPVKISTLNEIKTEMKSTIKNR